MGKIVAAEFVSLDGIAESPEKWHLNYFNDEMEAIVGANVAASNTLLLGRRTYQEWAAFWPEQTGELADYMNHTPKIVVSTTLGQPEWQHTRLISESVAEELGKLKQEPDRQLAVNGSLTLVRWLLRERLLDELMLMVHPLVLGGGQRLLGEDGVRSPLRLLDSKTLSTGVLALTYAPAPE